ncbi:MAG: hemerythrin domain-containing protein [Magnetococcus sp. DMHC-6]
MQELINKKQEFRQHMKEKIQDVGVSVFNKDHNNFLDILLEFHEFVERLSKHRPSQQDWSKVEKMLVALSGYALEHFKNEEELMLRFKYPELIVHKKEHDDFLRKFTSYKCNLLEKRDILCVVDLKYFMIDWFFHHVGRVDVQYRPFFVKCGVK